MAPSLSWAGGKLLQRGGEVAFFENPPPPGGALLSAHHGGRWSAWDRPGDQKPKPMQMAFVESARPLGSEKWSFALFSMKINCQYLCKCRNPGKIKAPNKRAPFPAPPSPRGPLGGGRAHTIPAPPLGQLPCASPLCFWGALVPWIASVNHGARPAPVPGPCPSPSPPGYDIRVPRTVTWSSCSGWVLFESQPFFQSPPQAHPFALSGKKGFVRGRKKGFDVCGQGTPTYESECRP